MDSQSYDHFIGILDIFGFESFEVNSFEQLCINYANEKLQQLFNNHIFKQEQAAYKEEGVVWEDVDFVDNEETLALIESKMGILSLLDEESRFPKATDETLISKLHQHHGKHNSYDSLNSAKDSFGVVHYAGQVVYANEGFLDKNKDSTPEDLTKLMRKSEIDLICEMFVDKEAEAEAAAAAAAEEEAKKKAAEPKKKLSLWERKQQEMGQSPGAADSSSDRGSGRSSRRGGKSGSKVKTVGGQFKSQLSMLREG
eukprot:TRINITY_DN1299_c0_g1_i7.p2 TRINITY_DN1299_c0_g1~~TRINITY_DN1299_c0_g1_i7.p2  ORF type:complete len:255 (+),score=114.09 TRINITY_DN1299_c0_g1_i7:1365-2129(+)